LRNQNEFVWEGPRQKRESNVDDYRRVLNEIKLAQRNRSYSLDSTSKAQVFGSKNIFKTKMLKEICELNGETDSIEALIAAVMTKMKAFCLEETLVNLKGAWRLFNLRQKAENTDSATHSNALRVSVRGGKEPCLRRNSRWL